MGILVRDATMAVDTSTEVGRQLFVFQLMAAEQARKSILQQTRVGHERAARDGRLNGVPVSFGYRVHRDVDRQGRPLGGGDNGHLVIEPSEASEGDVRSAEARRIQRQALRFLIEVEVHTLQGEEPHAKVYYNLLPQYLPNSCTDWANASTFSQRRSKSTS
jgi:hypothetical protein